VKIIGNIVLGYIFITGACYDLLLQIDKQQQINERFGLVENPDAVINDLITYKWSVK